MQRAIAWGVEKFKAAGADNVKTEEFTMPASWSEGATEITITARQVGAAGSQDETSSPGATFRARAVSIAWAPALKAQRLQIVDVGMGEPADFARAGDIKGKLLLVHSNPMKTWGDLFEEYLHAPAVIGAASGGGAKAIAFISTREHDLLYRHTNSVNGEIDRLPMVILAREDGERVARLLQGGEEVWANLAVPNRVGPAITTANVVAEIKGWEKPEEFVVLGAHLDSWELGTGALDNGCDASLVIDALRTLKAAAARPRRSIRFVLFSGEEQGLLGSHAYVSFHRGELEKAVGVVIFDSGTGHVSGFSVGGRKDVTEMAAPLIASLQQFGATTFTPEPMYGTDHFDFMLEGVPTFVANNEEGNYLVNYHASSDTFDKVDMKQLKNQVAEAAVLTYGLANTAERVGPRWRRAQIEQSFREYHFEDQMKALGIWDDWMSGKRGRKD